MDQAMPVEFLDATTGPGRHLVQFYADEAELAHTAGGHLTRALQQGGAAVAIATEPHRRLFLIELQAAGVDAAGCSREGRLVLLDAASTLSACLDAGRVDRQAFHQTIGSVIHDASAGGRAVDAYGEMVALLWEDGDVAAAIELEHAWNELATEMPFTLLCAYRSESVVGHEVAGALQEVCDLHTSVVGRPGAAHQAAAPGSLEADFAATPEAPGFARCFVSEVLQRHGHTAAMIEDAKLVVSELATNAVVHARSPFTVRISPLRDGARLAVRDSSHAAPTMRQDGAMTSSGNGLRLVDAMARAWGVEPDADGKTVWAELRA